MKKTLTLLIVIFSLIALVFIGVGVGIGGYYYNTSKGMVPVTGTIVDYRGDHPVIGYSYDGYSYTHYPSESSSFHRVGAPYELLVDPVNPANVLDKVPRILALVFSLVGVSMLIPAVIMAVILVRSKRKLEELLITGRRVSAVVTDVRVNYAYAVNRRHPSNIYAQCTNPFTGEHVEVKSEALLDPNIAIGEHVDVLFDPNDPARYTFDFGEEQP